MAEQWRCQSCGMVGPLAAFTEPGADYLVCPDCGGASVTHHQGDAQDAERPKSARTVTLSLPWPPASLSPNARVHWALKARAVKGYRQDAFVTARAYRAGSPDWRALSPPVALLVAFYAPDRRPRDTDNLIASLKAGIDGIVQSGLLVSDDTEALRWEEPIFVLGAKPGKVELRLREVQP